ncbi:MAG: SGNH/GDSL hydrolase family protein [Roseburia sp.]|nr:SGNH/GDSL hydrolase family protein [Roseburia sp.]
MEYQIDKEKGIANVGNTDRLKEVFARAGRGEHLTLGFLGGSITQGSLSSSPETCYAYRVYEWWRKTFPQAEFTYLNAGIGGTTSQFGVARAQTDLLAGKPDFVIIEFSVNDESTEHFMETYEGLVRSVCGAEFSPAVLLVHNVYYHNGGNAQLMHGRVGRHYGLPAVSMQSAIFPEVVSGRIENRAITPDDLHPNDAGHALVASVITYFLEKVRIGALDAAEDKAAALPAPLTANAYEHSVRYRNSYAPDMAGREQPVLCGFAEDAAPQDGITDCFKYGWTASHAGDAITFHVEGSCIAVQYRKSVRLPAPVAEVVVDGDTEHAFRLDANFDETWGDKLELDTVMEHGKTGLHEVTVRLTETHEKDAVPFYLVSVIGS